MHTHRTEVPLSPCKSSSPCTGSTHSSPCDGFCMAGGVLLVLTSCRRRSRRRKPRTRYQSGQKPNTIIHILEPSILMAQTTVLKFQVVHVLIFHPPGLSSLSYPVVNFTDPRWCHCAASEDRPGTAATRPTAALERCVRVQATSVGPWERVCGREGG